MKTCLNLAAVVALTSGVSAATLAFTHSRTRGAIEQREAEDRVLALADVFFHHRVVVDAGGRSAADAQSPGDSRPRLRAREVPAPDGQAPIFAMYADGDADGRPSYYAATGRGTGYTPSTPIEVLAGFTNPGAQADAAALLARYAEPPDERWIGERALRIVGWKTMKSAETPGLGDKIRDREPAGTLTGLLTRTNPPPSADRATPFQKQFRAQEPGLLRLRGDGGTVDILTAATLTTRGVIDAIADAAGRIGPEAGQSPEAAENHSED